MFGHEPRLVIIGAGDFARELVDIVLESPSNPECFFAVRTEEELERYESRPYRSRRVILEDDIRPVDSVLIGVGDPKLRSTIGKRFIKNLSPMISHSTVVPHTTNFQEISIGPGSILTAGCILTNRIHIGDHVLVNLACTIGHDVTIGSYSNLSPGCHINGHTTIGEACSLGSGVVTIPGASICDNCVIGAGAVVRGKIDEPGVYVGIPAKRIK